VIGAATALPAVGLQASTAVTFSASATDADGDVLQYQWAFGDGETGSGQTVSHVYRTGGTMMAGLAVTDGSATTTTDTPVSIVSLSGIWWSADPCDVGGTISCASQQGFYFTLTQTGPTVTGSWQVFTLGPARLSALLFNVYPVSGSVSTTSPRINLDVAARGTAGNPIPECFTLEPNADVTALSGYYVGGVCGGIPVTAQIPRRNPFVRTTTVPHA
jgi:PKD repeat protein